MREFPIRCILVAAIIVVAVLLVSPVMAATTSVHIVKYANDNVTILNETTVNYTWMEANLPVLGDGVTHYYSQGPTNNESDYWDDAEWQNIITRDWGAVKGTDLADLCDLVGGMSVGERVKLKASDGFSKTFPYSYVYTPNPRQGPMGITWYRADQGYVPSYSDGMRVVMFADMKMNTYGWNTSGWHVFGNADMRDCWAPQDWYNYSGTWPSSGGVSVKWISDIQIYSNNPVPLSASFTANATLGPVPLSIQFNDTSTGSPTSWAWDFSNDGTIDSSERNPLYTYSAPGTYSVNLTINNGTTTSYQLKQNHITITDRTTDIIYNGTVSLNPGETFTKVAYNSGTSYTINRTTLLGALDSAATAAGFTYDVTDKRWSYDQVLLLDNVSVYNKSAGKWFAYVNGVFKDGFGNHANGLNVIELANNDQVNFFYSTGTNLTAPTDAIAAVKIKVNKGGSTPTDWTLSLKGAKNTDVSKTYFEQGLACPSSGHQVNWTDGEGNVWSGVPLWLLIAMVDDNPDVGSDHFNFNDTLAAQGYSVKVNAGDGFNTTLASADIARNSGYIVANKLNGTDLPLLTPGGKRSWPLHLKGSAVFGGQQVGNITSIELTGMPQPSQGWTLTTEGDVVDVISQQYFEQAIVCHHNITYTDSSGRTWNGVPLWDLVGTVDDIETSNHWTFNDTRATTGYNVRVIAGDGFNSAFTSQNVSHNNGFIVANTLNGTPLSGSDGHLKLVGPATTSGSQRVGNITKIRLENLPSYPSGAYNLSLKGKISDVLSQPEMEAWIAGNSATYTDSNGGVYSGIPLWGLLAWVDDRIPAGENGFNDAAAAAGYKVIVKAGDGYSKEFQSSAIARSNDFIVANTLNGTALPNEGSHPPWPLRLVGTGAIGGNSVGNIAEIELTDFQTVQTAPPLHIIKYGPDGVTIINETNVTQQWMEQNLAVIGDGITAYKFEGLTLNPSNLWDPEETYPGGFKISNAVKGSRVIDLVQLVGGMGSGTTVTFVASDGFETSLPYSTIYINPAVQARQGDAILAWWGDGQYVPGYADGMRLFFTPSDHIYGQWDMHETLPSQYWRYNYQDGVQYPSCAGLSAKYITTIKVYSTPESEWTLELDGRDIGGINYTVSKPYFEEALACQFGSNHSTTYTDGSGRVWEGMPLWFLCGFIDDTDMHTANSYNDAKALAGYNITITGTDGYNYTFDSMNTIRNSNYIVANSLNGTHINSSDSSWPLRLVGQNVTGSKVVKKVASIRLTPNISSDVQTLSVVPTVARFPVQTTQTLQLVVNTLPQGLAGYDMVVTLTNPTTAQIVNVSYPAWAGLHNTTVLPGSIVKISAVDTNRTIQPGATNIAIANITIVGNAPGLTQVVLSDVHMDGDGGVIIAPALLHGQVAVYSSIIANFTANRTTGMASANVSFDVGFTDLSTGDPLPTAWQWRFSNGGYSYDQNPVERFFGPGNYSVTLYVSNAYNLANLTKTNYIIVTPYVEPFPGYTNPPSTRGMTNDYLIFDINGNGRLDFDDVVAYYQNMAWISSNTKVGIAPYDYNHNDRIDYDDVVLLYEVVLQH